jgi:hypothetical protein
MVPAAADIRDLNSAARVADNGWEGAVVDSGRDYRWATRKVADTAWEEIAVADNAWEKIGVADNGGKEVAVADLVEDNLVSRTGTGLADYDQVVVIPSGEAGRIGTHAAEVDAQTVEHVVPYTGNITDLESGSQQADSGN